MTGRTAMLVSLAALLIQSAPADTLVTLCNETPAGVAFSMARPAGDGGRIQRGWFTVAPGGCLDGAIGQGRAGEALVHARSGSFEWAGADAQVLCIPAGSHDGPAASPPCADGSREAAFAPVRTGTRHGRPHVAYTVACSDLEAGDARLCAQGRTGPDGLAAPLRELSVCNHDAAPLRFAWAGETGAPGAWRVEGWRTTAPGSCERLWRDFAYGPALYLRAERESGRVEADHDPALFCTPEGRGAFVRDAAGPDETACPEDAPASARFRQVRYRAGLDRLTVDFGGSN
ncbi:MAG: DUF1036 domain-containing protein [Oceanicaulis sp.]|nr:DUF1036 domain-containing protein [Oceanicaulis sp.]